MGLLVRDEPQAATVLHWAAIKIKPAPFTAEKYIKLALVLFLESVHNLLPPKLHFKDHAGVILSFLFLPNKAQ